MTKVLHFITFMLFLHIRCTPQQIETRWIDDILPDSSLDDHNFKLCNNDDQIIQYFNNGKGIEYNGGKHVIDSVFYSKYKNIIIPGETGLIRIRFVVNCKGQSGRFRMLAMNQDYKEKDFDPRITRQLMSITKSLDNWLPKKWQNTNIDYYQYLIFKIENGELKMILP